MVGSFQKKNPGHNQRQVISFQADFGSGWVFREMVPKLKLPSGELD